MGGVDGSSSSSGPGGDPAAASHKHTNRLAEEDSPYLLQHAHNPVDWYPWGKAAFEKARAEDKPIFLSVGYSTCHWCHVMEAESFESEQVAKLMNDWFVNIKVDREERPDADKVYMTYVQATQGGGGWPMSVFLTPELRPIVGGTYFPPDDRYGRPGFKTVLRRVHEVWKEKEDALREAGDQIVQQLADASTANASSQHRTAQQAIQLCTSQILQIDDSNAADREFWQTHNPNALAIARKSRKRKAVAYVCQNFSCLAATEDPQGLEQILKQAFSERRLTTLTLGATPKSGRGIGHVSSVGSHAERPQKPWVFTAQQSKMH